MDKENHTHTHTHTHTTTHITTEYYSVIKKNEMSFAGKWMVMVVIMTGHECMWGTV
jgi:hypothetical protein